MRPEVLDDFSKDKRPPPDVNTKSWDIPPRNEGDLGCFSQEQGYEDVDFTVEKTADPEAVPQEQSGGCAPGQAEAVPQDKAELCPVKTH